MNELIIELINELINELRGRPVHVCFPHWLGENDYYCGSGRDSILSPFMNAHLYSTHHW